MQKNKRFLTFILCLISPILYADDIMQQTQASALPDTSLYSQNTVASATNQPAIEGVTAGGEAQTMVVDENGNLQVVDGKKSNTTNQATDVSKK